MMRVLDIDLDCFLNDTCPLAEPGCRPALAGHEPWEKERLRRFLEKGLGLDRDAPVPGRIFETHDGALDLWDELIRAGRLCVPFEVTHVDAHSDLGIGRPGPGIVLSGALCRKIGIRADIASYRRLKQLDEANYLLYALSFRWVSLLENVRNPRSKPDMPPEIVHERDESGVAALRLTPPLPLLFEKQNGPEPVVSYREYASCEAYTAAVPFDFMSVAISPRYAPPEADELLEVFGQYMRKI